MNKDEIKKMSNQLCSVIMDFGECEHYNSDDEKVHNNCIKKHIKIIYDYLENNN